MMMMMLQQLVCRKVLLQKMRVKLLIRLPIRRVIKEYRAFPEDSHQPPTFFQWIILPLCMSSEPRKNSLEDCQQAPFLQHFPNKCCGYTYKYIEMYNVHETPCRKVLSTALLIGPDLIWPVLFSLFLSQQLPNEWLIIISSETLPISAKLLPCCPFSVQNITSMQLFKKKSVLFQYFYITILFTFRKRSCLV